jgi:hypothetical protein
MKARSFLTFSVAVAAGIFAVQTAWSANPQQVTANIRFDTPLTITKNADIDFKSVTAGVASTVYRMSTAGSVSVVSGPGSTVFGTPVAANLTIAGSSTQAITITVGNAAANGGASVGTFRGDYNGGGSTTFPIAGAAPAGGKTLLVGCDLTTGGGEAAGATAAPTFDITVAYQ